MAIWDRFNKQNTPPPPENQELKEYQLSLKTQDNFFESQKINPNISGNRKKSFDDSNEKLYEGFLIGDTYIFITNKRIVQKTPLAYKINNNPFLRPGLLISIPVIIAHELLSPVTLQEKFDLYKKNTDGFDKEILIENIHRIEIEKDKRKNKISIISTNNEPWLMYYSDEELITKHIWFFNKICDKVEIIEKKVKIIPENPDTSSLLMKISDLNIEEECVTVINTGDLPIQLNEWKIRNQRATHTFTFPDLIIRPKESIIIFSNTSGNNSDNKLYWTRECVWNKKGDKAYLYDSNWHFIHSLESRI